MAHTCKSDLVVLVCPGEQDVTGLSTESPTFQETPASPANLDGLSPGREF